MVLELKLMGKLATSKKKLSARQNQGTQTYGETSYFLKKKKKKLSTRQNQGLA